MPLSPKTQKHIWGLFAGRCAICKEELVFDKAGVNSLTGEVAHIVGDKPKAARNTAKLSSKARNHPDNLLLLCREHHKIIDDNPKQYSVDKLHDIRTEHLNWVAERLSQPRPYTLNVSYFSYLNVPRLGELAALSGFRVPKLDDNQTLKGLGLSLPAFMESFRATLHALPVQAVNADNIDAAHESYIGQIVSFDRLRFRTRNMPLRGKGADIEFTGNLEKDPHVYRDFGGWTLILSINPVWTTTTTAYLMFRPSGGASVFSGFARIVDVDLENQRMVASPLALGAPPSNSSPNGSQTVVSSSHIDLSHLEDDVSKAGDRGWYGPLDNCDICGRPFFDQNYMIDGAVKGLGGMWACMCSRCYVDRGRPLGLGKGQLYRREGPTWKLVGGYPLPPEDDAD